MRFSSDHLISDQSCLIARLERQIRAEEQRISSLHEELRLRENPNLRSKWLNARVRLRDLRLELMRQQNSIF
jgi:hypothetical protein